MGLVEDLEKLRVGKVTKNPLMKKHTTYQVGGKAIALITPNDTASLIKLMDYVYKNNIKYKLLGNGSNVIFNDSGYNGIIIKLDKFDKFEQKNNKFTIGSGVSLIYAAMKISKLGYTGFEFATGIPGTLGGAIYMNAGAYQSDMGYIVTEVKVLTPKLEIETMYNKELDFHYRSSFFQKNPKYIVLEATVALKKGKVDAIMEVIEDRKKRRLASQPLKYPSAGSVFRNPKDDYAGRLIEELGYKGKRIGGAEVSTMHANFIINTGKAKGEDVKKLITEIKDKVKEKYDIDLKVEQEFID